MNARWSTNLMMGAVVMALGTWLYLGEPTDDYGPSPFQDVDPASVDRIEIAGGGVDVVLELREGRWWYASPFQRPAQTTMVERLVSQLRTPTRRGYAADEVDRAAAGLTPPRRTLRVAGIEVRFGGLTDPGALRYLQFGDTVYTQDDTLYPLLPQAVEGLVPVRLVAEGDRLTMLVTPGFTLERGADAWALGAGELAQVGTVAERWAGAEAMQVSLGEPPEDLEGMPIMMETAWLGARELIAVHTDTGLDLYEPATGLVYRMPPGMAALLLPSADPSGA